MPESTKSDGDIDDMINDLPLEQTFSPSATPTVLMTAEPSSPPADRWKNYMDLDMGVEGTARQMIREGNYQDLGDYLQDMQPTKSQLDRIQKEVLDTIGIEGKQAERALNDQDYLQQYREHFDNTGFDNGVEAISCVQKINEMKPASLSAPQPSPAFKMGMDI